MTIHAASSRIRGHQGAAVNGPAGAETTGSAKSEALKDRQTRLLAALDGLRKRATRAGDPTTATTLAAVCDKYAAVKPTSDEAREKLVGRLTEDVAFVREYLRNMDRRRAAEPELVPKPERLRDRVVGPDVRKKATGGVSQLALRSRKA